MKSSRRLCKLCRKSMIKCLNTNARKTWRRSNCITGEKWRKMTYKRYSKLFSLQNRTLMSLESSQRSWIFLTLKASLHFILQRAKVMRLSSRSSSSTRLSSTHGPTTSKLPSTLHASKATSVLSKPWSNMDQTSMPKTSTAIRQVTSALNTVTDGASNSSWPATHIYMQITTKKSQPLMSLWTMIFLW